MDPEFAANDWPFDISRIVREACCHRCVKEADAIFPFMLVCHRCGNKRCPKSADHRFACTNSNEPGQVGHVGEDAVIPPPVVWERHRRSYVEALEAVARAAEEMLRAYRLNRSALDELDAADATERALQALREARR